MPDQPNTGGDGATGTLLEQMDEIAVRMVRPEQREDPTPRAGAKQLVAEFVQRVTATRKPIRTDTISMIEECVAEIDRQIEQQLNQVMHHEAFLRLEASWRGLHYLVFNTETGTMLKLRLLDASKDELLTDFEKASEFDQSTLFKKIYEEEYGTFGGHPYGVLIGDYEFTSDVTDMKLLEELSHVAAAAHAPLVAMASPRLFDMDRFIELGRPRDLAKLFESSRLVKWASFRKSEDARYVALTLPHILMRLPYGRKDGRNHPADENRVDMRQPVEEFNFVEEIADHSHYAWGNAAWALGARITDAFAKYKWCAAIRGVEGGGIVQGLPTHVFQTDEGDVVLKCPTEIAITDRRENELNNLGFIALVHCKGTDYACFFGGQTTQLPKKYITPDATANAALSARLPYILAASRFAHYVKVIMRDKVGSFADKESIRSYLNRWISQYTLANDDAGQALKAEYPLREARIDVSEVPGKPGSYRAVVFLRPHFQLEDLTASIRLVAELPPPAAA